MSVSYSIVPGSVRHIRPMSRTMRAAAGMALSGYGFNPREALRRAFVASMHVRTALIEGRPVAMWGVAGTLLGESAQVWLVIAEDVRRLPVALVKQARNELSVLADGYGRIDATLLPDDEASIRFAKHLGFAGDDPDDDVMTDERYRIPLGDAYAIRLAYHPEAR